VVLPLLQQSVMFFNIAFSRLVLRKKLAWQQYVGALAVVVGVCFAALPESGGTSIFAGVRTMSVCRCTHSTATQDGENTGW
jgi:drug/metabolite transporter (DMT)-like permease